MNAQNQNMPAQSPAKAFQVYMQKYKSQLEMALPKHMTADRMMRLTLTEFSKNPKLQQCSSNSIFSSIIIASQLGLEPGVNGQGYLVPYNGTCTFIPGWKGLVDLAQRGGRSSVWTGAVYEGDEFDYMLGDSPYCRHKPCGEFDESKLTHVYAIGRVKDSEMPIIEVWPVRKVREHFKKTVIKGLQPTHYSHKHFEAYAKKVALLQVLKYMPQSIELSNAVDVSSAVEQGKGVTIEGDFVNVDTSQQDSQDQNIQNSTQNEAHHLSDATQDVQTFDQEEVIYVPSFEQIKKGILTAKSVVHLEVIEEQALDHANSTERKHLMTLIKAQYQKFQVVEESAAKKPESEQAAEPPAEKPKRSRQPKAIEEAPATDNGVSVDELKRLQQEAENLIQQNKTSETAQVDVNKSAEIKKSYMKTLTSTVQANSINGLKSQIEKETKLTEVDRNYLLAYVKQRLDEEGVYQQGQAPVDKIKSTSTRAGLERMIADTQDVHQLETETAQSIKNHKAKMTVEDYNDLLSLYAQRKEVLSQQDIFADAVSLVDSYIAHIDAAQSVDRLNDIMSDPAINSLPDDDTVRINEAYDRRYAEISE
ncbi:recombinase RecT [Acinetobacter radioresistens]|uniref:recombinase RecT n=1 Tax=Acinetobacter radioresistens TaxID=40216 RepID=UPI002245FDB7|nr:recombinase RecT [Acinetobacter radioresistens]MCX0338309.1 recombinase RecT [Acinetobacter radioresistens]